MKTRVTIWELCVCSMFHVHILSVQQIFTSFFTAPLSVLVKKYVGHLLFVLDDMKKWCKPTATSDLFISPINLIHLCKQWARGGGANSSESVSAVTMYSRYTEIYGAVYLLGKRWCETHMKATKTGSVCDGDMCCESMKTGLVDIIWNCICSKLNAS